jgi:serine/threonine protein kinase
MSENGKYQKQGLIGSGERVDVFHGVNIAFDRKVAIKELREDVKTSDNERNAFYSEYEKWAKLEHPSLVRIEDIDRTRAWIIQEHLPQAITAIGDQLAGNMELAHRAIVQILEGLQYLHTSGVLHCNLKASNVRVNNGQVKLCDGRCIPIGFPGALPKPRGSNRYLAPEMINEDFGSVGTATDIYLAGIVILETLAGDKFDSLFKGYISGTPDTEMGWVRWHNSTEQLEPIHTLLPSIPKPLADILDAMVCKPVQTRYANTDRLLNDLNLSRDAILSAAIGQAAESAALDAVAAKTAAASVAPSAPDKMKLIDRPASPSYVRCLSGPLAGSIFPTDLGDIKIGCNDNCNVKLSSEKYPELSDREIHISMGNDGWQISETKNHPIIIDSKKSFDPVPLRSGSIFRLSSKGPDFQFVVQGQQESTWQDIAAALSLFAPRGNSAPARSKKKRSSKAPAAPTGAAPRPASAPSRPSAPQTPAPARPPSAPTAKTKPAPPTAAPSAPMGPAGATAGAPLGPAGLTQQPVAKKSFTDSLKDMDESKRNNLILFVSLPVIALLIILFMPRSNSGDEETDTSKDGTTPVAESSESASKEPSPTDAIPKSDTNDSSTQSVDSDDSESDVSEPDVPIGSSTDEGDSQTANKDGD